MAGQHESFEFRVPSFEFSGAAKSQLPTIFHGSPEPLFFKLETLNSELETY